MSLDVVGVMRRHLQIQREHYQNRERGSAKKKKKKRLRIVGEGDI